MFPRKVPLPRCPMHPISRPHWTHNQLQFGCCHFAGESSSLAKCRYLFVNHISVGSKSYSNKASSGHEIPRPPTSPCQQLPPSCANKPSLVMVARRHEANKHSSRINGNKVSGDRSARAERDRLAREGEVGGGVVALHAPWRAYEGPDSLCL